MPPFFIELGNELIIVHLGCVILGPSNGAKTEITALCRWG